jgi:hypothetical protein
MPHAMCDGGHMRPRKPLFVIVLAFIMQICRTAAILAPSIAWYAHEAAPEYGKIQVRNCQFPGKTIIICRDKEEQCAAHL